jgi:hypothetical protein
MFYTYVLRCADGNLYIGSAVDLQKNRAAPRGPSSSDRSSTACQLGILRSLSFRIRCTLARETAKDGVWPSVLKTTAAAGSCRLLKLGSYLAEVQTLYRAPVLARDQFGYSFQPVGCSLSILTR